MCKGETTLVLKLMGRVNQSPKQRVPAALQNDGLSPQKKNLKQNKKTTKEILIHLVAL